MWWSRSRWRSSLRAQVVAGEVSRRELEVELAAAERRADLAEESLRVERVEAKTRHQAVRIIADAGAVRFGPLHVVGLMVDLPVTANGELDEFAFACRVFDAAAEIRKTEESNR